MAHRTEVATETKVSPHSSYAASVMSAARLALPDPSVFARGLAQEALKLMGDEAEPYGA
jgi:hypothetical protein